MLDAVLLGLVQGLTEFLPISSSGHLVLGEYLLGLPPSSDITFEVFVHFGTFLSVVVALWGDVKALGVALVKMAVPKHWSATVYREDFHVRLLALIALGTIPAAIVGLTLEEAVGEAFADPKLVAVMLVLTGLILFLTRFARPSGERQIGAPAALLIGLAQALAILPGISRSGSTISTGMYLGVSAMTAARFSFLLALPAIAGATLLQSVELFRQGVDPDTLVPILAGTLVAFGSGVLAIKVLLKIIGRGKFGLFAYYCLFIGTLGILFI